jgi:hypothetical protein
VSALLFLPEPVVDGAFAPWDKGCMIERRLFNTALFNMAWRALGA